MISKCLAHCLLKQSIIIALVVNSIEIRAQEWKFSAGLAAVTNQQAWLDSDPTTSVVPILSAQYGDWSFLKQGLIAYKVYAKNELSLQFGLDYRDYTYDSAGLVRQTKTDNPLFEGYNSPDGDWVLTVSSSWHMFDLSLQQDISDSSTALTVQLGVQVRIVQYNDFTLIAAAGSKWFSQDFINHTYGISGNQVSQSRERIAYQGESAINYQLGLTAIFAFNKNWQVITAIGYEKLDSEITDSPLIGDEQITSGSLGMIYSF